MKAKHRIIVLLLFWIYPAIHFGQDVEFTAAAKSTVSTGETFQVVFRVNAQGENSVALILRDLMWFRGQINHPVPAFSSLTGR